MPVCQDILMCTSLISFIGQQLVVVAAETDELKATNDNNHRLFTGLVQCVLAILFSLCLI